MGPAEQLWEAGIWDLVCVTPPDGDISPRSRIRPQSMGKSPGLRNADHQWHGYDWRRGAVSLGDAKTWDLWEANVGVRAGPYPAVDLDVEDPELTGVLAQHFVQELGPAPRRTGREPHALLVYRAAEGTDIRRSRVRFMFDGQEHLVEVLGEGQQWVAKGTHPSGAAYDVPVDEMAHLTEITEEDVQRALDGLVELVEILGGDIVDRRASASKDRSKVDQEALKASDPERLAEIVREMPNTDEHFPDRQDYITMGYAVKAALGEDGFDAWWAWCEKWPDNTLEEAQRDWQGMKPPFEIGEEYILEKARDLGMKNVPIPAFEDVLEEPPPEVLERRDRPTPAFPAYTEAAVAEKLVHEHGNEIVYCKSLGGWLVWDGPRWVTDELDRVGGDYLDRVIKEQVSKAKQRIENANRRRRTVARLSQTSFLQAVRTRASMNPRIRVPASQFDSAEWEICSPTAVVDLQSGETRTASWDDYNLMVTEVAPVDGRPDRWLRFLEEATDGDQEFMRYLQKLAGYLLTGSTREHALFFLYGPGGNGKSVFVNALAYVLGDYAKVAPMDTFLRSAYTSHPTDLASLRGARLVTAQETQEGRSWDEQRIKALTSGDPVTARFMRQDFFTYTPGFKLLFSGNHRPRIDNLDEAWRRRMHLIPFTKTPPTVDPDLPTKLQREGGQILRWAIEGCRLYREEGLDRPAQVAHETERYFDDSDPHGRFIEERLRTARPDVFTTTEEIFNDWRQWSRGEGIAHGTKAAFGRKLAPKLSKLEGVERGKHPSDRTAGYLGITLRSPLATEAPELRVLLGDPDQQEGQDAA